MRVRHVAAAAAVGIVMVGAACSPSQARVTVKALARSAAAATPRQAVTVGPVTDVSRAVCGAGNAEVEEATWRQDVYAAWICEPNGPSRIAFARSADAGKTWSTPVVMPGSVGAWDPAVSVAPNGTLYVSFMNQNGAHSFPVVDVSRDQGKTFPQHVNVVPRPYGNWGDRDFITAGPHGLVYLTWDYAPTAKYLRIICPPGGSCSFAAGELNAVIQRSTNYGRTWGPIMHVSPGFPASGADLAPLLIGPGGRIDVVYQALSVTNKKTMALGPGHEYFTSSGNGGKTWTRPVVLGPRAGTESIEGWWIDGAIADDAAGNLYATWDTQAKARDTGWLAYSTDGGKAWSAPVRVTPDNTTAPHIVQSAGGARGIDYVGWLSASSPHGYAQYLRVFQIGRGWLDAPVQVSRQFGARSVWPGDTFGIATLPGTGTPELVLTWGSAVLLSSHIYAAKVTF
ncbi:MAG TPA: sialidase family protein [Trebonia sp.]|nr:sialidase family protein [Trebonia sp.]